MAKKRKDKNAQAMGRKRWRGVPSEERSKQTKEAVKHRNPPPDPEVRKKIAAVASKGYWGKMSKEERSAEMKRRAKVREANKLRTR